MDKHTLLSTQSVSISLPTEKQTQPLFVLLGEFQFQWRILAVKSPILNRSVFRPATKSTFSPRGVELRKPDSADSLFPCGFNKVPHQTSKRWPGARWHICPFSSSIRLPLNLGTISVNLLHVTELHQVSESVHVQQNKTAQIFHLA